MSKQYKNDNLVILSESSDDFIQKLAELGRSNIQTFSLTTENASLFYNSLIDVKSMQITLFKMVRKEMPCMYYQRGGETPEPEPVFKRLYVTDFNDTLFILSPFIGDGKSTVIFKSSHKYVDYKILSVKITTKKNPMLMSTFCCDSDYPNLMFES